MLEKVKQNDTHALYDTYVFTAVWARLKLDGMSQFSLSPGKSPAVAVFIPEKNVRENEMYAF